MYSVHPVYMNLEKDGRANMVFLKNSNAMGKLPCIPCSLSKILHERLVITLFQSFFIYRGDAAALSVPGHYVPDGRGRPGFLRLPRREPKPRPPAVHTCNHTYISFKMPDQKALEVFSDMYPYLQDLIT